MLKLRPLLDESKSRAPLVIAGPCSAETERQTLHTALAISEADCGVSVFRAGLWKPRTRPGGFEGVGEKGLAWLLHVKQRTGMLVATEVATAAHVRAAFEAGIDLLWIGARTTANPFAVQDIADALQALGADVPVLVKNPLNPDIDLWIGALQRLNQAGISRLGAIHRGFSAYDPHIYRNLPQWHIPIELRRRLPDLPIICDPSHIAGRRELIGELSQQALDLDFDGLIIESHCSPHTALSDSNQQLTPEALADTLRALIPRQRSSEVSHQLSNLRRQIDSIDNELLDILARRMEVSRAIGEYKKKNAMPVFQVDRHDDIVKSRVSCAINMGLGEEFVRKLMSAVHEESVRQQLRIINNPEA